ncbi:hypothetical protein [Synechococcus sp. BMK-MC-1]|uniref:hypothetical protein n=1 Tax=Synechococcus sp. BMK-MC-1 TaxID=1442551 RepID=UPI001648C0F1|nr:hypothetical protein [Synechococcus sp. BMK-MC-1]QNI68489.1 hypothetical protein SynBMKMC1_02433 [Synechococcus sp. BMK-MC-1]
MTDNLKSRLTSKKVLLPTAIVAALVAGTFVLGTNHNNAQIEACNTGNDDEACEYVLSLNPKDSYKSKLDPKVLAARGERIAAAAEKEREAEAKAEADRVAAREAADKALAEQKRQREKAAAEARAAEAKFKAEGWFELATGIYGRWCTDTCSKASVIGNQIYWLLEVWAKDRAAGNIYARVNILQNGTVVGWTNDTAYLSKGQRGVMTFAKYLPGYGSNYGAQITEFNARG